MASSGDFIGKTGERLRALRFEIKLMAVFSVLILSGHLFGSFFGMVPASSGAYSHETGEYLENTGKNRTEIWGFTWHFSWDWVNDENPETAMWRVNSRFQDVWDHYLKPTGCGTIRNDVNIWKSVEYNGREYVLTSYGEKTINRLANLCLWAEENGAYLFPILKGAGEWYPSALPEELEWQYVHKAKVFVLNLADELLSLSGGSEAYKRIAAYEIENEMNDVKRGWPEERQKRFLGYGADAIREAETEANVPELTGRYTRIAINPSYEPYPIGIPSLLGYKYEYPELKAYIKDILDNYYNKEKYTRSNIDIIGLDYYPGSLSYTSDNLGYYDLIATVKRLCDDFGRGSPYGKEILVAETGYTDLGDSSLQKEQKNYYRVVTVAAKNFYSDGGAEKGFLGIIWYGLFDDGNDENCWMDIDKRVRNFGIIETPDSIGGGGGYGVGEKPKDAWLWLADNPVLDLADV